MIRGICALHMVPATLCPMSLRGATGPHRKFPAEFGRGLKANRELLRGPAQPPECPGTLARRPRTPAGRLPEAPGRLPDAAARLPDATGRLPAAMFSCGELVSPVAGVARSLVSPLPHPA